MPPIVICKRCHEETEPHLHGEDFYCDVCASYMQSERTAEAIMDDKGPMAWLIVQPAITDAQMRSVNTQFDEFFGVEK